MSNSKKRPTQLLKCEKVAASTCSRYTNDRDYRAVVRTISQLLHTPQLTHQRAVEREQLQRLTWSVVVSDEFAGDGKQSYEIDINGGIKLHVAVRVDGEHKYPVGVTVMEGEKYEIQRIGHLYGDPVVFAGGLQWSAEASVSHSYRQTVTAP